LRFKKHGVLCIFGFLGIFGKINVTLPPTSGTIIWGNDGGATRDNQKYRLSERARYSQNQSDFEDFLPLLLRRFFAASGVMIISLKCHMINRTINNYS
jgi:hypothetical protein